MPYVASGIMWRPTGRALNPSPLPSATIRANGRRTDLKRNQDLRERDGGGRPLAHRAGGFHLRVYRAERLW